MDHHLLENTIYYLIAALVAVPLFKKLKLGAILGYLCAGAVIGPQILQFIHEPEHALHFAEFGVVMLLFVIGLELDPEKLWRMRQHISLLGGGQLLLCALVICALLSAFTDIPLKLNFLIGLTLALSSTAFAIQLMGEQGIMGLPLGRKGFAILLLQDLAVIPILLLVGFLAPASTSTEHEVVWWYGPAAIAFVLVFGKFALNPILKLIAQSAVRELLTASALLIVLGTAYLMLAAGLTMGMGAFLAGIILANSSFKHQLEADIEPFKGLLLGLFFIAVGMSLDLQLLISMPLTIISLALILMAIKTLIIAGLVRIYTNNWRDCFLLGLILSQGGEFAFVVMSKSLNLGLVDQALSNKIVLIVGLSMALTAPLVMLFKKMSETKTKENKPQYDSKSGEEPEVVIAGFGRFGQIIGRILAANNLKFTALDKDAKHVNFVRQFGNKIFFGDAVRADLLEAAGIDHALILVVAVDNIDDSLNIVKYSKERCPKLKIIARARNRAHAYQLTQLGVKTIIRETFESSLVAAQQTLMDLEFTEGQSIAMVEAFRAHDESLIRKAAAHKDDMEKLVEIAAEGRKELHALFEQDHKH